MLAGQRNKRILTDRHRMRVRERERTHVGNIGKQENGFFFSLEIHRKCLVMQAKNRRREETVGARKGKEKTGSSEPKRIVHLP